MNFIGWSGTKALYSAGDLAAVVDSVSNVVHELDSLEALVASADWETEALEPDSITKELATAALAELDITVLSSERMYTIPAAAKAEAKRALEWRKEHKRGGTPVGLNTARTLAKGGQVGIKKVRHIAKYFPRHEVDKKAKGYKPGQDGYPSNGRIAWALWGGDAAQRWAANIVESADKQKGLTAGYYAPEPRVDYKSFDNPLNASQFFIRIRLDGGGIDRLYKMDAQGECRVWDDGCWEDMGNISHDFLTYDKALDDPYDTCKKLHIPVDEKTAIAVSAIFDTKPFSYVTLPELEPEESDLFQKGFPGMEWDILDQLSSEDIEDDDSWDDFDGLLAAGFETDRDGNYTPEERSEKASTQVRDALGRFAQTGTSVVIGGNPDYKGTITSLNPDDGTVNVQMESGETVAVPGNLTQQADTFKSVAQSNFPSTNLDFSGILGEPRVPIDQPLAKLPGRLPPLSAPDVNLLVSDWSAWVAGQRLSPEYSGDPIKPFVPRQVPDANTAMGRYYRGAFNPDGTPRPGWNPAVAQNVYNEPLLRNWLDQKYSGGTGKSSYQNIGWYRPPIEDKMSRDQVYSPGYQRQVQERYDRALMSSAEAAGLTPETSDVPVMYLAIVAEDDPQAVMDLVSIVPASKKSNEATSFVRKEQKWVRDDRVISDLKSATPPPVIVLSNEDLSSVVEQVDGNNSVAASALLPMTAALTDNAIVRALIAAGGLDRNRGNAENLRRYWTIGKGGLKILWNTPGDWTRCNRQLKKYMGPRAKGYCALRHKEMTGVWPGSKYNVGKKKKSAVRASAAVSIETLKPEEQVISEFTLRARSEAAKAKMTGRGGVKPGSYGASFIIPLVIPEEMESGDGRYFKKDSIEIRDLPLPLMWQIKSGQGHDGSVVVGQITHMEKTLDGIGNAYGVFDTGAYGREAERLVKHGFIRGVSADMDKFATEEEDYKESTNSKKSKSENPDRINITSARVMAVTIVPKPAFQECFIQVVGLEPQLQEKNMIQDGVYIEDMDAMSASALVACGMVASSIPLAPPLEWFENPKLQRPTPLTILDDGRVFGHIAAWNVDHIGMAFGTKPPRSRSKYAYFHTGSLKTEEGVDMPVGQLTLAGGHAGMEASAQEAVRHYDDTASAFADVHAGEDAFGIWVSGALRPGTTPEQIRAARASAPSGDWRPINGRLELVAVCQVNVPGFPIARARVASGQVLALVAAGASVLAQMKHDPLAEVIKKIEKLESAQKAPLLAAAGDAKGRVAVAQMALLEKKKQELSSRMEDFKKKEDDYDWGYMIQMLDGDPEDENAEETASYIPRRIRERLAREGKALPDGSFPIRNIQDLKNAVRAYGRAKPGSRGSVRKHIIRRARGLRRPDLIPNNWKRSGFSDDQELSLKDRALAAAAALEVKQTSSEDFLAEVENFETVLNSAEFAPNDPGKEAKIEDLTPEELEAIRQQIKSDSMLPERDDDGRIKYTPKTQPRDARGKFRRVLARLKSDLGVAGLSRVMDKVEKAENLTFAGDYAKAAGAAADLISTIDRLDTKALNPESIENIRTTTAQLGRVIANLPFAFGEQSEKIRFSDVPPALRDLMEDMIDKVEEKIGKEDADVATSELRNFMSGGDYYSQADISSQMSKLLRLLT
jgi:hypothetical protein